MTRRPSMRRRCRPPFTGALIVILAGLIAVLASCGGGGGGGTTPPPPTFAQKFKHVVVIFQENRTPDNLFHGFPGADIADSGVNSSGQVIPLTPIALANDYDLSHAHSAFVDMYDNGKMDGADKIPINCNSGATDCPPTNPQFMYVDPSDVQPYFQLGEQYAFGDRMFQTNQGPSFPAHQFIISGTSAPTATSTLFVSENPAKTTEAAGCIAPADQTVKVIDAAGSETSNPAIYPCFEHPTLTDSLDNASITWRYYAPSAGSIWTAPDAINHMCEPSSPTGGNCTGPDWTGASPKVVIGQTQSNAQILTDIASNQLQQVSWVIPTGQDSDHALSNNGCGPSWVTSIVNAIGNSEYWSNTAIVLTWDDWGGWYDHVPPAVISSGSSWGSGYVYGFRVPMVVLSPYAKAAYVSHVTHDFGSILKFIETNFNLPLLGFGDAPADYLSDIFNFSQTPLVFQTITPPSNTASCLADPSPATDQDDD